MAQEIIQSIPPSKEKRLGAQPSIWHCGNTKCNNLVSDVDQKTIPKKYCSDSCRQFVKREKLKLRYREKIVRIKEIKHNFYLRHRDKILDKAKKYYQEHKGERRAYSKTPKLVRQKLIYYLTHQEERKAYQREYYRRKKNVQL